MRDVFYTLLVAWIIWRILNSVNNVRTRQSSGAKSTAYRKPGETTVDYVPPSNKRKDDDEGEYVDYEEIK
jgi:hypothetical protein